MKQGFNSPWEHIMKKGEDYTGVTVVYFCHDGKGNFLLSKRSNQCRDEHGCWDPGGGGLEFGDTIENTLQKEIGEEYCTDVLDYEFLGFRDVHRTHNNKELIGLLLISRFSLIVRKYKMENRTSLIN
jgi:ADP-ribose pyrophosphatase YjhB (NUDIX family)